MTQSYLDLPGIKKTDINVAIEGDFLCIRAERKWEHDETTARLHRTEREFGKVERSFRIPENVDKEKLTASFENGVLKMWLPKCNTDKTAEAVRIPITDENEKFQFSKN